MTRYTVNLHATDRQIIGEIDIGNIYRLPGIRFPKEANQVWLYPGLIKHVQRDHPGIFQTCYRLLPSIIASPDYIGKNPKEANSIEFFKQVAEYLLL